MRFDRIRSFSYLGTIVYGNDTLEEQIRGRTAEGNKAFYVIKTLLESKLMSRKSKLKVY
jgi:hypothetical protein